MNPESAAKRASIRALSATARGLLAGGWLSLGLIAAIVAVQRLALPVSVIWLGDWGYELAAAALFGAAALSFVRARAADRLARAVRLSLLDVHLRSFEHGAATSLPSSEAITARLAVALPTLVSWAVEGVAVAVGAAAAVPLVAWLLASELGFAALVPLGAAGLVGAAVTMAASGRVEVAWGRVWDRSRALLEAIGAGYEGAIELRAHGRAGAFAAKLRGDVVAWSAAEGRARALSAASSWGALMATLAAGLATSALLTPGLLKVGQEGEVVYKMFLLVLAAIPTLQALVGGIANMLYARDELESAHRQRALAASINLDAIDEPIDATTEVRLEGVRFTYPTASPRLVGAAADSSGAVLSDEPLPALRDVSIAIPPRASLAILGPNGAGKTTLLYLLLGVIRPDAGSILVGGREARLDNRRWHERVAFLSQRPFELKEASIAENLRAFEPGAPSSRLISALETVSLWKVLRARASSDEAALSLPYAELSRGQARRVMLARALLRDADLLILDEPEAHLDAESVLELRSILERLSSGRRVIAAVHDPSLAAFTDCVINLRPPDRRALDRPPGQALRRA
ncbi:MAG TPA: ATP-binding cassette domain-containing protein [Polyangiaceae bacterium]|nr:ATP-binding cassette domain-containing protein [Polyangiaceae bacterium]